MGRRFLDPREIRFELFHESLSVRLASDHSPKHQNCLENLVDRSLIERDDVPSSSNELPRDVGLKIGKGQDQSLGEGPRFSRTLR